jgi:hypothetical protein
VGHNPKALETDRGLKAHQYFKKIDGSSRNAGKRGFNPAKGGRPKDFFEIASTTSI